MNSGERSSYIVGEVSQGPVSRGRAYPHRLEREHPE